MDPSWPFDVFPRDEKSNADPPAPQTSCSLLSKLPGEVRNEIYKLVFATEEPVDLLQAAGLETALLDTCRQIETEAIDFYHEALRDYWSFTCFFINEPFCKLTRSLLQELPIHNTSRITTLEISHKSCVPIFSFSRGVWTCIGPCCKPHAPQRAGFAHPRRAVVLPPFSISSTRISDPALVSTEHKPRKVCVPRYIQGRPNYSHLEKFKVATLRASVVIENNTANRATGWQTLSGRELVAMTHWFCRANYEVARELYRCNMEAYHRTPLSEDFVAVGTVLGWETDDN